VRKTIIHKLITNWMILLMALLGEKCGSMC